MAENVKLFRTAMRGFNKEDVTEYIEKMNFDFSSDLESMKKSLDQADEKLIETQKKLDECISADEENKALKAELDKIKAELESAKAYEAELQIKISENEELIAAQNDALDQLCKENEALKNAPTPTYETKNDPELEEKARLYDKMSSKIGEVIIDANRNADSMISCAKNEGDTIIENAKKQAEDIISDAKQKAECIYSGAKKQVELFSENYRTIFDRHSKSIEESLKEIENKITNCNSELNEKSKELHI